MRWMLLVAMVGVGCAWTNEATRAHLERETAIARRRDAEQARLAQERWQAAEQVRKRRAEIDRACAIAIASGTEADAPVRAACISLHAVDQEIAQAQAAAVACVDQQRAAAAQERLAAEQQAQRERLAAIFQALSVYAQTRAAAAPPAPSFGEPLVTMPGCTSDYDCSGYGQRCVRKNGYTAGQCMKIVDQNGLPSLDPPPKSITGTKVPYEQSCTGAVLMCPIGFRCDRSTGACVR
jgi:hypothetical protein